MRIALRSIVAVLAGFVAALAVILVIEVVNSVVLFPFPDGIDPTDYDAVSRYLAENGIPTAALAVILTAYVVGSALGGAVAALFAGRARWLHAAGVAVLLEVGGIMNLQLLPHPVWFVVASLACYLPAALLGAAAVRGVAQRG